MTIDYWDEEVGTGITKTTLRHYKNLADALDVVIKEGLVHTFEGLYAEPLEKWSRAVLLKAGHNVGPDLWRMRIPKIEPPDSPEGYAREFLILIRLIRGIIKDGRPGYHEHAARFAFELGRLAMQAKMKFEWDKPAMSGKRRADDLKLATEAWNDLRRKDASEKHTKWNTRARKVWEKHPTWGAKAVAEVIATPGENPDYIRQIIRKP